MSDLKMLVLDKSPLSGTIPSEIGQLGLCVLWLESEFLTGTIPPELFETQEFYSLFLGHSAIVGKIVPPSTRLSLVKKTSFSPLRKGSIPTEIGLLSNLMFFRVRESPITGELPSEIGALTNLECKSIYGMARVRQVAAI
jgi:hypothetical protein